MQRKKTLLPFLDARTHTSTFLDHRFGEGSANLTPEEKALERFTAERTQRLSNKDKKARFNLGDDADDDDEDAGLTHGGVKLGFGDEEELEAGGWGGLGDAVANGAEGANREPLLRRRMAAVKAEEEEEEQVSPIDGERAGQSGGGVARSHADLLPSATPAARAQEDQGRGHGGDHGQEQDAQARAQEDSFG